MPARTRCWARPRRPWRRSTAPPPRRWRASAARRRRSRTGRKADGIAARPASCAGGRLHARNIGGGAKMAEGRSVVLLGDSILDNGAYTRGGPHVAAQVQAALPEGWRCVLAAVDGATTE